METTPVADSVYAVRVKLTEADQAAIQPLLWVSRKELRTEALCHSEAAFVAGCALYDRRCAAYVIRSALRSVNHADAGEVDGFKAWSSGLDMLRGVLRPFVTHLTRGLPYRATVEGRSGDPFMRVVFGVENPPLLVGDAAALKPLSAPVTVCVGSAPNGMVLGCTRVSDGPFAGMVHNFEVEEALGGVDSTDFVAAAETLRCIVACRRAYTEFTEGFERGWSMAEALRGDE